MEITGKVTLVDKFGTSYILSYTQDKDSISALVSLDGHGIGMIKSVVDDNETFLTLWNIEIFPVTQVSFIKSPLRWLRTPKSLYRRKLGTCMLKWFIKRAKSMDIDGINGIIRPEDFAKNPNLPNWYRKYGFVVEEHWKDGEFEGAGIYLPFK